MLPPRPAQPKHVPGATAAAGRGARLRRIVKAALDRRRMLDSMGKSRRHDLQMELSCMRLATWLDRNPWPSDATVDAFLFEADVIVVMPSNNEGRKRLTELRTLLRA